MARNPESGPIGDMSDQEMGTSFGGSEVRPPLPVGGIVSPNRVSEGSTPVHRHIHSPFTVTTASSSESRPRGDRTYPAQPTQTERRLAVVPATTPETSQPKYSPEIDRLIAVDPDIRGTLSAHPQVKDAIDRYYAAQDERGPVAALDEVLRPDIRKEPLREDPVDDLRTKVAVLQAVVKIALRDVTDQPDDAPAQPDDPPVVAMLKQRRNLFAIAVDAYVRDHKTGGDNTGPQRRRSDMNTSGDRFRDQYHPRRR